MPSLLAPAQPDAQHAGPAAPPGTPSPLPSWSEQPLSAENLALKNLEGATKKSSRKIPEVLPSDTEVAVLIERERCARIAYDHVSAAGDGPEAHKGSYVEAAMKLAELIRSGQ